MFAGHRAIDDEDLVAQIRQTLKGEKAPQAKADENNQDKGETEDLIDAIKGEEAAQAKADENKDVKDAIKDNAKVLEKENAMENESDDEKLVKKQGAKLWSIVWV